MQFCGSGIVCCVLCCCLYWAWLFAFFSRGSSRFFTWLFAFFSRGSSRVLIILFLDLSRIFNGSEYSNFDSRTELVLPVQHLLHTDEGKVGRTEMEVELKTCVGMRGHDEADVSGKGDVRAGVGGAAEGGLVEHGAAG